MEDKVKSMIVETDLDINEATIESVIWLLKKELLMAASLKEIEFYTEKIKAMRL